MVLIYLFLAFLAVVGLLRVGTWVFESLHGEPGPQNAGGGPAPRLVNEELLWKQRLSELEASALRLRDEVLEVFSARSAGSSEFEALSARVGSLLQIAANTEEAFTASDDRSVLQRVRAVAMSLRSSERYIVQKLGAAPEGRDAKTT